jgi:hypothetical protein
MKCLGSILQSAAIGRLTNEVVRMRNKLNGIRIGFIGGFGISDVRISGYISRKVVTVFCCTEFTVQCNMEPNFEMVN